MAHMKKQKPKDARKAGRFCCVPKECAAVMKVLSEAPRLLIIRALIPGPCHVATIAEQTGLTPARVSHHLGRMRFAGVVECSREGRTVIYQITPRIAAPDGLDLGCCRIRFRKL
jgi:DNA-binding transcriptional ArsR family regulator